MTETIAAILADLDKLTGTYRRRVAVGKLRDVDIIGIVRPSATGYGTRVRPVRGPVWLWCYQPWPRCRWLWWSGPAADGGVRPGGGGSPVANCSAAVVVTDDSAAAGPLLTRWNKPGKPVKTPRGGG